jgi:tRNA dimethylallyltransferase
MPIENKTVIVIGGPTGSGKTTLAIQLAKHFNCSIISADARQIFRELKIGSAAPNEEELKLAPHFFVGDRSVSKPFNAGIFEQEAIELLNNLFIQNNIQVVCGGSGLYINALLNGMDEMPETPKEIRDSLNLKLKEEGLEVLRTELIAKDPSFASQADLDNPQRIIRALEIINATGQPYSSFRKKRVKERNFKTYYFATDVNREELYNSINIRTLKMIENGWLAETEALLPYRHLNALQTVGYKELFQHLDGKINLDEAIALIQQNTRRYAKRQVTWLKNQAPAIWINPANGLDEILKKLD